MDIIQSMSDYILNTTKTSIMMTDITGIDYRDGMTVVTTNFTQLRFKGFICFR